MSLSGTIRQGMALRRDDQQQGLDYLLDDDRIPRQLRGDAQSIWGGLAGIQTQPENVTTGDLLGNIDTGRYQDRILKHSNLKAVLGNLLSGKYGEGTSIEDIYNDIGMQEGGKYRNAIEGSGSLQTILEDLLAGEYNQEPQTPEEIQQGVVDRAKQSPLYGSIMGNWENSREQGEEAIMRNASMTGGLRSGDVQENLYDYNTRGTNQAQNQALLQSYNQQLLALQGLMGMPSGAPNIANQYNTMGQGVYEGMSDSGLARAAGGGGGSGFNVGSALGGALQGGMAGFKVGGPWGAVIGGGLGGVGGGYGGGQDMGSGVMDWWGSRQGGI